MNYKSKVNDFGLKKGEVFAVGRKVSEGLLAILLDRGWAEETDEKVKVVKPKKKAKADK